MPIYTSDGETYEDELSLAHGVQTQEKPITKAQTESMTHQPEQENTAKPYLDTFKRFMHGGISEAIYGEDRSQLAKTMSSESSNAALGLFGGRFSPNSLGIATKFESAGYSPGLVKELTGLERGAEGMWRKEISDAGSKLIKGDEGVHKLGEILDHPALYEMYPEAKDIGVSINSSLRKGSTQGRYSPVHKSIEVASNLNNEEKKESLIHEVQHWIQDKEGFSLGHVSFLDQEVKDRFKGYIIRKYGDDKIFDINKIFNNPDLEQARVDAAKVLNAADWRLYNIQAHEQEAFNTTARIHMTPEEIKKSLGSSTETASREHQIVHKDTRSKFNKK